MNAHLGRCLTNQKLHTADSHGLCTGWRYIRMCKMKYKTWWAKVTSLGEVEVFHSSSQYPTKLGAMKRVWQLHQEDITASLDRLMKVVRDKNVLSKAIAEEERRLEDLRIKRRKKGKKK